ncbi:MAG TPA: (Fe-S)-binding protein [Burkholderiales bacterium]|nr:(Fe-S)-binding protein [Burkholderiales bacterium]
MSRRLPACFAHGEKAYFFLIASEWRAADRMSKPNTLRDYVDGFIEDTLTRCTRCARCFEACPMTPYSERLTQANAPDVVSDLLKVLRGSPATPEALDWIKLCTQSATCIKACPEGINAMLMLRVARMGALGSLGGPRQMEGRDDPLFFRRITAFAETQFTAEELEKWHR